MGAMEGVVAGRGWQSHKTYKPSLHLPMGGIAWAAASYKQRGRSTLAEWPLKYVYAELVQHLSGHVATLHMGCRNKFGMTALWLHQILKQSLVSVQFYHFKTMLFHTLQ
jgi:hypothetical protein